MKRLLLLFLILLGMSTAIASTINTQQVDYDFSSLRSNNKPLHTLTSLEHEAELIAVNEQHHDHANGGAQNIATLTSAAYTVTAQT